MGRLPRGVVWTLLLSILIGQSVAQGDFGPPDSYDLDLGSTPADIVFVVDTSGFSNSTESLNQEVAVKGFLTGFLENADINSGNVKVAMVTYSTHPKVIFDLNKYSTKTDMEDAVFLADFEEEEPRERNLADALSLVRTKILVRDRRDAPNFVLLLMSGKSDRNSVRTLQEADGLKFARANIFGIGISLDDDDAEEMFEVSSKPTMENTFLISSVYELEMLRELVFMQIFARAEQAFKAPAAGSETLDLAFLLHYSNSVSREDFQRILDFMKNILQYSDIDDDKLRVGAVVFRKRGIPLFDFNNYYSQEEVFGGIDQINYNYRSKTSSIASGFDTVRTSLFTRTGGEREPAPNLVILITDSNADTDVDQTITAVERMKADGAAVYVVGINVTYPEELLSIASNPSYNVLVKDASELEGHDEQFHNDFVALRAKGFPVVIPALESSTSGTFADTTPVSTQNSDEAEIVFLVHASKKTTTKDFKNNLIQYIIGIIQRADTTKNKFGVVMYGDSPEVVLKLTSFPKAKLVKKALKKIKPNKRSKRADLLKALSFVREQVFNGDDPNLPNGIVLIRDQKSKRVDDNHLGTELSLLEASGTNLFQIGIGQQVENDKESELVTNTFGDDSVTNVGSYGELSNSPEVVKLLSRKIRSFHQEEIDLIIAVHTQHNTALKNVKKHIQVLLKDILSAVDINSGAVQVSIVTFGAKTKVHFPLNAFNKDKKLMKAFKKIKRKEYRSKGSDLMTLLTTLESDVLTPHSGDRQGVENLILVITDSASSSDLNMLKQKAEEMKKGNTIFAIGVDSANEDELKALASSPENEFFYNGKKYDDLTKSPELREQMIRNVKIFESLTVPATTKPKKTTPKPKVTKADTTTTTPSFTTTTRSIEIETTRMTTRQRLFTTTTTPVGPSRFYVPLSVSEVADIVLLVHLSPRITEMEFITVQEFLKSLVSRADIANGKAQIGLVFYGADPEIIFHINQYNDIALMQKSIDGMRADLRSYTSDASTAIASAKQMLSPYFNRRDDVPAAMIFIADDPANTNFDVMRDERDRAIEDEIRILTVGIGVSDKSKLESLASDPDFIMNYDNVWMLNDAENDLTEKIFAFQNDGVTEDKLFEETTLAAKTTTPADTTVSEGIITKSDGIVLELPSSLVDPNKCSLGNSDLVIILDASTSVTQQNYDKMLQFTKDLLQNADIDSGAVRVGILIYSTEVQVIFNLNEYSRKADVFAAIDKIPYIYGSTNTADALQTMHAQMFTPRNGDRPNVPNTGIIITDGVSNINSRRTISEADDARTAGIHVYAIGIGLTDTRELDGIANTPKTENSFNVQTFDELVGLDRKIFSALCPEKAVTVPVTTPKPKSSCGLSSVDVVIIIDASTSVTEPNFKLMLEFCKDIVKGADIDSGSVRVGVLIYSTEVEIQFHLNRYSTNAQVIDAIDKIPYIYGSTNTADALLTMHQTMFTPANGDRQGVENVAIVLTDGVSNINSRRTIKEAVTARSKDIEVYVIGISLTDTREVEGMASEPKDKYLYNVRRFEELQGLEEDIFGAGEGGDCATPAPATPAPATLAPKTECGLSKVDAVIILDASTSVTEPNFKKMLSFCKEIVDKAAIDSGSVRIGVLIYSTEVEIEFHLNKYTNTADIKAAIDRIPYIYGSTNSADALKTMHEVMFTARNGDRPDVDNIAFMITDGISNINGRRTIPEAENAQGKDIRVYAIGIGLTDTRELEGMASEPKSENMFNVREFDELTGLIDTIFGGAEECALSEPPVANAGPDVTRRYPSGTITLDGRRSSDDNGIVTYTWSQGGRDLFTGATFDLYDLREGEYEYNLTVVDEDGQSDSDTVRVIIEAEDFPPNANAGDDVTIQLPVNSVRLDGRYSSDDVAVVQYMWKLTNGQPGVSFEGDDSATPMVDNLEEGEYTFTLTVADALGQTDDDTVNVYVKAQDFPPKANAGDDVTIQLPVDSVLLDGRKSSDDIAIVQYMWKLTNGQPGVSLEGDESARLMVEDLEEGEYTFTLTVTDALGQTDDDTVNVYVKAQDFPPKANAGDDVTIQLPVDSVLLDGRQSSDDIAVVKYSWKLTTGPQSVSLEGQDSPRLMVEGLEEGEYAFTLTVSDVLGQTDDDTVNVYVKGQDFPPRADAGEDITIKFPKDNVELDGTRSSDDIKVVRYSWALSGGEPGNVRLGDVDASTLRAEFAQPGSYTFNLTVYDGAGQMDQDSVNVVVEEADIPPVANAGNDVTIQLPLDYVTLDGTQSSDDGKIVSYNWVLTDGASSDVDIIGNGTPIPAITNLKQGNYTFSLEVTDDVGLKDKDSVEIVVKAPDNPPVADAGRDVSIQLPVDTVTLDGSRSSDDIRIVQYLWTLVSGAPGVQTTGDTSSKLLVEGLAEGDYTFALSVFDALGQADEDEVTISVRAGNQPPKADAGEDVEIQLPVNEVTLDGRRSTDDVRIARYRWRIREGDENAVVMDGDRSAVLQLSNLTEGTYGFSLTVADNEGERDTDYVNVVVKPEPTPTCGFASTDLVFVVDASTSVTEANFKKQLAFMKNIVNYADIDSGSVRVGALIYSTEVEVQFYLNQYSTKNDVIAAIDKIPYIYGSTNTADGLQVMRDELFSFRNGDRDDAPNIAMVITDGVSNINGRRTIPEAITTRDLGIKIFAVGIGLTDTRELEGIASIPSSDNAFAVSDFDELVGLEQKIFTSICDKPSTTPPTTPTTTTTTQATPTTTSGCGLAKTDLVFILDASTSVTDANFQKMRDFLKEFLSNADIDSGSVRVGVNIYSTDVQVEFHLNRYTKAADVMSAIDNIPYIYGSTNTADALQSMANVMFTPQNGDRPDAPNVCILLTDGVSNINSRRTIPEAERARAKNVHLYVIGIGLTDTREVTAIATPPASKNLFSVNSFDELKGLHKTILNTATCKDEISEPPVADAGSDRTIQLPLNSITLSGDGSRDDVGIVRYEWSQLSGPRVNVRDTNDPMLSVDRLTEGVYEFELNVTDVDGQSDTDTVVITVLPEPDLPPRADAGPDKQVKLPNDRVTLSGRGSSDDKRITRWVWRLVNGNARGVTMSGQNTDTLDLSRLQEGTYTFGLTVYDAKGQMDEDEVTITVAAAPDAPPVANAGQDYTIQLPDDSVTLDGSRSSDDVRVITYRWKMTQGYPGSVRMSGERTPRLNVNGLSEGEYVFTLTVTDGKEQLDEDEARVIVKKAPRVEGYDVIFVLDSSVTPEHFRWMNNYARAVVREMSIDDGEFRVGYLIYSNSAYRQFDLQDYGTRSDVLSAIDKVGYRPGTKNTAAALKYARKQMFTPSKGDREYAKNYLILLTGDNPSDDPFGAATEACQLQAEGVGMFGVGFGDFSNRDELTAYSSVPNDEYQSVMRQESDQSEAPGLMLYNLKNRTPRPSACPVVVTTPYNGDCFASGDIVFILDSSGSVGQDNFYRVLNFTYSTIDGLDIDSGHFRVGVTTFSDSSRLDFNLNDFSNKQDIHDALTQVRYMYGNTHTAHALRRARLEMFQLAAGDRPDVPNVIVIITDGQSNINHEMTIPEARHLKAAGVTIITLAVGFTSETSELVGLTSPPISENLVYTEDYESLSKVKDKLIEPLCHDSNMCRSSPCQNGGVCMDGIRSYICICPDDFFGDTCSKHCGEPSDVVIVLDSSNTVGEYNFGRLKEYSEHLVREMNKDSCDVNIGFMKYSSNAMVQVHLGTYDDTETNVRAVEQISYSRGRANMAAAFRSLRTEMFNGRGGDRPGARNIAYFLTDGTNDAESEMAESEAEQAISSGIRIVPIGINLRERFELDNIAEKQNLNVIEINDEPALIENTDVILRPLYEGSNDYCAENPCSNGGQCVNEPFGYSCECDIGYTGDTCTQRCSAKGDVVFAVDTSRYVTRKELKSIRRFLRSVVKRLKFNKNEFSVGMVQFTDWAQVSLTLSQGKSKKAVRKSIAGLRVHGGDPQPSIALAKAKYRIFDAYGEDKDRPNYLILITKSMRGEEDILTEANKLKLEGTRILGVGLGLTANEREYLESSVSIPFRETAMFADDRKEMDDLADRVVEYMCDDENLCAENPCRNGGVCQRLGGDFYCDCGVGYAGRYCENTCNARADIVFLLDSSGSIGHKDFRRVKKFVHNMVSDLQIGKDASRIGLATYSSKSRHGFFMSKYDDLFKLQNAIAGISYEYGNSNAAEGLRLVREHYFNGRNGDRSDIQDFLVVITDGVSNVQPDQTLIEANLIKEKGVHVYAVGIGEFDPAELNEIASKPASENAYILSDYSGLDNISNSIIKQTCRDPSVCDENPCRNGGVCVPGINGLFCECRRGYRGVHCEESCVSVKDIFFLLDSSDSVGTQNFEQAKKFINNIIEEFSSKDSFNRFSLLTYSDEVQIVFSLGRYNSLNIIQNAVKYARYRPGNTNTASALRVVDELSTEDLGDRYDAENIVFVITDGTGNVNEDDTIAAADNIKNKGARVITVGINMDDPSEVESMASSKRDSFKINKYDDLEGVLEEVVQNTCKNGNVIEKK
ncbi:uncharacterized protein LOC128240703 isoform X3 [Mya arenaria]|uniref:uncharacterized protein LOC128240703 isoform X3 n=1 Tax=Mya arenaria TaxID=6604 RepID=UPI0022E86985|nr:uncharacterized protein LOC128240703 isoform X3 [Mya arenaria]